MSYKVDLGTPSSSANFRFDLLELQSTASRISNFLFNEIATLFEDIVVDTHGRKQYQNTGQSYKLKTKQAKANANSFTSNCVIITSQSVFVALCPVYQEKCPVYPEKKGSWGRERGVGVSGVRYNRWPV
jgi:hypothetical protein